eukprot:142600-Pleurochrysis_carterae.AAC.1
MSEIDEQDPFPMMSIATVADPPKIAYLVPNAANLNERVYWHYYGYGKPAIDEQSKFHYNSSQ